MHQTAITLIVTLIGIVLASNGLGTSSHTFKHTNLRLDPCMACLNAAAVSIEALLYVIVDRNSTVSCDTLYEAVNEKSGSPMAGAFSDLVCQAVGIE
jgi:hypothetical protein